jgi:hypothetical protein
VAASDYSSSGVGYVQEDGGGLLHFGEDLGNDPALAVSRGRAFFVNRKSGLLFELDTACGTALAGGRINVNDPDKKVASNPWDVAAAPDGALWVPRYNLGDIAVVKGGVTRAIDLSAYDADGNPQPSAIRITDTPSGVKAFVTLERLDDADLLRAKQPSMMVIFDVASLQVERTVTLEGRNPFNTLVEDSGGIFVAMPGNFDSAVEADAGIERFDIATNATRLVVHENDLGASVAEVAVSGGCGAAILADATPTLNRTSLATFDAKTGAVLAKNVIGLSETFDKGLRGLTWARGGRVLFVGDRAVQDRGYAVHAFERDDMCNLHALPDQAFVRQKPVSVRSSR